MAALSVWSAGIVSSTVVKAQGLWADSWGGELMRGRQEASLGFSLGWCLRTPADIQTPRRQEEYMSAQDKRSELQN